MRQSLGSATVTVTPLSAAEHDIAIGLVTSPEQSKFVAANDFSIAQAARQPECVPMLIRSGGEPVGFAMYALAPEDGEHWIYRFMIDQRFQRMGIGTAAIGALVRTMLETTDCPRILIGVVPGNEVARKLYERAGFVDAGYMIDGEDTFILERSK